MENIDLQEIQLKKIIQFVDQKNEQVIKIQDFGYFFLVNWCNFKTRTTILSDQKIDILESDFEQQISLNIKIVKAPKFLQNNGIVNYPEIFSSKGGVNINRFGINQDLDEGTNGNGEVKIGRQDVNFKSDPQQISFKIKYTGVSRQNCLIKCNTISGFCLQCLNIDGENTFLNMQYKEIGENYPIRPLYKHSIICIDEFYKIIVSNVEFKNQQFQQQQTIQEQFKDLIPQNIKKNKMKFFQQQIQKAEQDMTIRRRSQQIISEIIVQITSHDQESREYIIQKQPIIIKNTEKYQDSKELGEYFIGSDQIDDKDYVPSQKLFKIYFDKFEQNWFVQCVDNNDDSTNIMLSLRNKSDITEKRYSNLYNLETIDSFGILIKAEDQDPDINQCPLTQLIFRTEIEKRGDKLECGICQEQFYLEDAEYFNMFECDHFVCSGCQKENIVENRFNIRNYEYYQCMECEQKVKVSDLEKINKDLFEVYKILMDSQQQKYSFNCFNCKEVNFNKFKSNKDNGIQDEEQLIKCKKCKSNICGSCQKKYHGKEHCTTFIKEMAQNYKFFQEPVRFCPNCFFSYTKDKKCDHVDCHNCGMSFCFICSCIRQPTLEHGNHYHRQDCKHYYKYDVEEYRPDRCIYCKKEGKACTRPKSYVEFIKDTQEKFEIEEDCIKNFQLM